MSRDYLSYFRSAFFEGLYDILTVVTSRICGKTDKTSRIKQFLQHTTRCYIFNFASFALYDSQGLELDKNFLLF